MAFWLFRYMLNIDEYHMKVIKNKKFPFIYPLVFYNGIQNRVNFILHFDQIWSK
ncbi:MULTISPECIES: Rpn family recombination-promoting nuclease/putative transposase [Rickettsia]|uniref:Transposase (putative) YhgA-like domain-containing protein n=1 Tax=Rickettsia tamurae subsp. buchneri TaxID=1462938 RepID=A0A8E1C0E3_9RICK|nr:MULTISPECIES: Rpn family recombination-promoting nuclease/putative transposase [Rickettsia]KDO03185.1 hypothetical protein REISMN_03045 [Rickettsia tamurae subsp. buchneri]KJW03290.1 transposase, YhgA-like family protein [Rickettsia endosymbiont of Ixodes pacificus]